MPPLTRRGTPRGDHDPPPRGRTFLAQRHALIARETPELTANSLSPHGPTLFVTGPGGLKLARMGVVRGVTKVWWLWALSLAGCVGVPGNPDAGAGDATIDAIIADVAAPDTATPADAGTDAEMVDASRPPTAASPASA